MKNKLIKYLAFSALSLAFIILSANSIFATATVLDPPAPANISASCDKSLIGIVQSACTVLQVVNISVFIVELLVIIWFILSVTKYLAARGDDTKLMESKDAILKSIIAIAIIFGINIILQFLQKAIGISGAFSIPFFSAFST